MLVVQLLILAVMLLVIPAFAGGIFSAVERGRGKRLFQWVSGQLLLWVGVETIAVLLLMQHADFEKAVVLFWCYIAAVLCYACGARIRQRVRMGKLTCQTVSKGKRTFLNVVLWFLFGGLVIWQLVQRAMDFYTDMSAVQAESFYITTPFSVWIAFLAEVSGMSPVRIEQTVFPIVLMCMSYSVFYLLGAKLFVKKREHHALFLVVVSLVAIGGQYLNRYYFGKSSTIISGNSEFLMLVSVLVPYLVLLVVIVFGRIRKKKRRR